jgi:predicted transcriptional regulator
VKKTVQEEKGKLEDIKGKLEDIKGKLEESNINYLPD